MTLDYALAMEQLRLRRWRARIVVLALLLHPLATSEAAPGDATTVRHVGKLQPHEAVERELGPGQTDVFTVEMAAGLFAHVVAEQKSVDVAVTVVGPDGKVLVTADSPNGTLGPEPASFVARQVGVYEVRVTGSEGAPAGRYRIELMDLREPTQPDLTRIQAESLFFAAVGASQVPTNMTPLEAIGNLQQAANLWHELKDDYEEGLCLRTIAVDYGQVGEMQKALEYYMKALPLHKVAGDSYGEAVTLHNIGRVYTDLREMQKALAFYNQALPLFHDAGDRTSEGHALNNIGSVYWDLGEKQRALEYYMKALSLHRDVGDQAGEAATLNNIGIVYSDLGEKQKALQYYNQALPIRQKVGDRSGEADTLNNIGIVYSDMGEKPKALEYYNKALPIRREVRDRSGEAATLNNIGIVYSDMGEKPKALEYYNQALPIRREVRDRSGEAATLHNIGVVCSDLGEKPKALEYYMEALPIRQEVGDRSGEAKTLNGIGSVYDGLGQEQKALEYYQRALPIWQALGDRNQEVRTLHNADEALAHECDTIDVGKDWHGAVACLEKRVELQRRIESPQDEAQLLARIGSLQAGHDEATAKQSYNAALDLFRRVKDRSGEIRMLRALAQVYSNSGEAQAAYRILRQSLGKVRALFIDPGAQTDSVQWAEAEAALFRLGAEVRRLTSTEATAAKIAQAIEDIGAASDENDLLVVYYTGSGISAGGEFGIMASGSAGASAESIPASRWKNWIAKLRVRVAFLCFDVPYMPELEAFERQVSGVSDPLSALQATRVLVAGPAEPQSLPGTGAPRPALLLAKALAGAFAPEADSNHDGFLTFPEIEAAMDAQMLSLQSAGETGGMPQRARFFGSGGTDIAFATGVQPAASAFRGVAVFQPTVSELVRKEFAGRYSALIIATDEYDHWDHLSNPILDAQAIATELHDRYGFEPEIVRNPTTDEFRDQLAKLKKMQFGPDDELLIFIAGHGIYDETEKTGYLIAKDSKKDDEAHNTHISQLQIYKIVSGLNASHVFLVIDACYGGAIAGLNRDDPKKDITYPPDSKLEALRRKRNDRTRIFLTSGGKEYVPDGQPGSHSPFAYQFLRALKSQNPDSPNSILTFIDFMAYADQVQNAPQPKYGWFPDSEPASDFWLFADPNLRNGPAEEPSTTSKTMLAK